MKINKTRHPVTREPLWYYEDATMDGISSFFGTYMHPDYDICLFDTITGNTISFDNVTTEKAIPLISRYCTLEDSQVEFIGVNSAVDSYVVGFPFHKQATPFWNLPFDVQRRRNRPQAYCQPGIYKPDGSGSALKKRHITRSVFKNE